MEAAHFRKNEACKRRLTRERKIHLPITAGNAAILATLLIILAILTARRRMQIKAEFGDGGDRSPIAASRSHANLAEYAPIFLILLALLEHAGVSVTILAVIAGAFTVGRILYLIELHQKAKPRRAPRARQIGVILTWVTIAVQVDLVILIFLVG